MLRVVIVFYVTNPPPLVTQTLDNERQRMKSDRAIAAAGLILGP